MEPVEYALMAALAGLVMIGGAMYAADNVSNTFGNVGDVAVVDPDTPTATPPVDSDHHSDDHSNHHDDHDHD